MSIKKTERLKRDLEKHQDVQGSMQSKQKLAQDIYVVFKAAKFAYSYGYITKAAYQKILMKLLIAAEELKKDE